MHSFREIKIVRRSSENEAFEKILHETEKSASRIGQKCGKILENAISGSRGSPHPIPLKFDF